MSSLDATCAPGAQPTATASRRFCQRRPPVAFRPKRVLARASSDDAAQHELEQQQQQNSSTSSRRSLLLASAAAAGLLGGGQQAANAAPAAAAATSGSSNPGLMDLVAAAKPAWPASTQVAFPNYAKPGPFSPAFLPPLEHICEWRGARGVGSGEQGGGAGALHK